VFALEKTDDRSVALIAAWLFLALCGGMVFELYDYYAPHFHLTFFTFDASGKKPWTLGMTNRCLVARDGEAFPIKQIGALVVPLSRENAVRVGGGGSSTETLAFSIVNDSSNNKKVESLALEWGSDIKLQLTDGWKGCVPRGGFTDSVVWEANKDVSKFLAQPFPLLKFQGISNVSRNGTLTVTIITEDADPIMYSFEVVFVVDTNMSAYIYETSVTNHLTAAGLPGWQFVDIPHRPP
jgi:hypothetical protein